MCVSYLAAASLWQVKRFPAPGHGAEVLARRLITTVRAEARPASESLAIIRKADKQWTGASRHTAPATAGACVEVGKNVVILSGTPQPRRRNAQSPRG
jgi:hypothetical protein